MVIKILRLILLLSLVSCAHQAHFQKDNLYSISYSELFFPRWFIEFPQDTNLSIGISYKSNNSAMIESAKENAAIFYCRNKASVAIDKYAQNYQNRASFSLNVSANPDELVRIKKSFTLVDSFFVNENFVGLFSIANSSISDELKEIVSNHTQSKPDWYKNNGVHVVDNRFYCTAHSSSSSLMNAFNKASQQARLDISSFLQSEVNSELLIRNKYLSKFVSIETDSIIENFQLESCYVSFLLEDSLPSYHVYLKMSIH